MSGSEWVYVQYRRHGIFNLNLLDKIVQLIINYYYNYYNNNHNVKII